MFQTISQKLCISPFNLHCTTVSKHWWAPLGPRGSSRTSCKRCSAFESDPTAGNYMTLPTSNYLENIIQLGLSENWGYLQIAILRAKWNGWFISGFWEPLDVQSMPCGHTWLKWNWTYAPNLGTSYKSNKWPFPSFGFMADHPNEEWTRTRKWRIVIKVYIIHHYLV